MSGNKVFVNIRLMLQRVSPFLILLILPHALSAQGRDAKATMGRIRTYFDKYKVSAGRTGELQAPEVSRSELRRFISRGQHSSRPVGQRRAPSWWRELESVSPGISLSQEGAIGLMVAGRIVVDYKLYENEDAARYVNLVGRHVAAQSVRPDVDYQVFILKNNEPQALSTPGGFVFISVGLLRRLSEEDELAFALGHEIAHVARFHGIRSVKNAATTRRAKDAFAELDALDPAGTEAQDADLEAIADEAYLVAKFFRSRSEEFESDWLGADFAVRAGYRKEGSLAVLKMLQQVLGDAPETAGDTSTHPTFSQRIKKTETHLERYGRMHRKMTQTRRRFEEFKDSLK